MKQTEKDLRARIVTVAESWLGRKEADGSHKGIIDVYNAHKPLARGYKVKYTDAWCATFGSAVAIKAGLTAIIPTECGCEEQIKGFQAMNAWKEADNYWPQPGDYIFYDWDDNGAGDCTGWADHVGIVVNVDYKTNIIKVIEGNKNDAVGYREILWNGKYIRGYGVPAYDALIPVDKPAEAAPKIPWYQADLEWVVENGIADGTRAGDPATRAEVWAMLHRMYNNLKE